MNVPAQLPRVGNREAVGEAPGNAETPGDCRRGVACRGAIAAFLANRGANLVVVRLLGPVRRAGDDEDVLAARFAQLDLAERRPHDRLVELRQLAGDADVAVGAERCREVDQRPCDAVRRLIDDDRALFGGQLGEPIPAGSPARGKNPSKTNRLVGRPLVTSAATSAVGPGTVDTS